jgi:hypothetical protein
MIYLADDLSESEVIWNSRDGVTPFVITLRSGKVARHVSWEKDVRDPDFKPPLGSRVFVDLSMARARQYARENIAKYPEHARLITVEDLAAQYYGDGHNPDLIEVSG